MRRREFGRRVVGGAFAATAASRVLAGQRPPRVVIAGAGIIGASIAYHLARRGADVTVCEKARPAAGATAASFAWINSTFSKEPRGYYELNRAGIAAWRRLEAELPDLRVQWGGGVEWYPPGDEAEKLRRDVRRHQEWGYSTRLLAETELRTLVPGLRPGPVGTAAFSEEEGAVDPVRAVRVLLAHAERLGARVLHPCPVTAADLSSERVTALRTGQGRLDADVFVLAAGVDAPPLASALGLRVPLKDAPGVLAHTAPLPHRLERIVLAPGAHVVQRVDGRVVTGSSFGGTPGTAADEATGRALLREAARALPFLADAPFDRTTLGFRVLPEDEFPIVGFALHRPNVYVASMHSGVTLAPLVGALAAREILDGVSVDALAPYRLARFA